MLEPTWHVIHLDQDEERRRHLEQLVANERFDSRAIRLTWESAVARPDQPAMGCLQSHLNVLRRARDEQWPFVALLEDDADWTPDAVSWLINVPPPSGTWHMLYLGGHVLQYLDQGATQAATQATDLSPPWRPALVLTTHAYLVNSVIVSDLILELEQIERGDWPFMPIDQYYSLFVHPRGHSFVLDPVVVTQRVGHSHIALTAVNYDMVLKHQGDIPELPPSWYARVQQQPEIPHALPGVTIVTPTRQRASFLKYMTLPGILHQTYPLSLIEWIIVDEQDAGSSECKSVRHVDVAIRHLVLEKTAGSPPITIAQKRNVGAQMASHDIIVHMDDDDYYPPGSVAIRVAALQDAQTPCVGCRDLLSYDIYREVGTHWQQRTLYEASMAYRKSFWKQQGFEARLARGEGYSLLAGRTGVCRALRGDHVMVAIQHNQNVTGHLREAASEHKDLQLWDQFPFAVQHFLHTLRMVHLQTKQASAV